MPRCHSTTTTMTATTTLTTTMSTNILTMNPATTNPGGFEMRLFLATILFSLVISGTAFAQATSDDSKQSDTKKSDKPAATKSEKKSSEKNTPAELAPAPAAAASQEPKPPSDKDKDSKELHYDMTEAAPIVTHHEISMNGRPLKYTATTGRLPIKRADGKIEAEMFFVAYTLDGEPASQRPLTFSFNGGPGSASIWLHMGALGPRKVVLQPDGFLPPSPYHIEDNPYTLLDKSDIVMIDAMGTGFSRAADSETFRKFWGVKGDIEAFSEFIRLYITRNERWTSPLFMLGESYGTTRAAGIAGYLADRGISFNGITLLSTVLNFQTLVDNKTNDQPYVFLIPTFTMVAAYHHKLAADLQQNVASARQQSEQWAFTDYAQALAKGDSLTPEERQKDDRADVALHRAEQRCDRSGQHAH